MSTKKLPQKSTSDKTPIAILGALILLAIVLTIGLVSYNAGKNYEDEDQSPIPVIDLSKISGQSSKVLGLKILNLNGKVISLRNSSIILSTEVVDNNGETITKEVNVAIDASTQLVKWDLSKSPTIGQPDNRKEPTSLDQFKPGSSVIVQTENDITKDSNIEAISISLLVTPSSK